MLQFIQVSDQTSTK